ncbi:DUF167 domain-containing protein [Verrucomicrobium sp. 3C]|uniref:DUF167 domain-containing protein n=1 Tax=Verrucomicrobium sp. 3C TaxID=1134055 RepID=UPI000475A7E0|nr:DUF167 domain-containing protein [Verrucomicrobium sp. 3C]
MTAKRAVPTKASGLNRNRLVVRVVPNARKSEIAGFTDGVVRVRLQAPPSEGRANEELLRLLAKVFCTRRSQIVIVGGEKSREKSLEIQGWEGNGESAEDYVARWLERASGPGGVRP